MNMRNTIKELLVTLLCLFGSTCVDAKIVTLTGTIDNDKKQEQEQKQVQSQPQPQYDYDNQPQRTYEGVRASYSSPKPANVLVVNYVPQGEKLETVMGMEWRSPLGNGKYTGDWDKELFAPHGRGVMVFDDGSVYSGHFVDGNFDGENEHYWLSDGDSFHGVIQNNLWVQGVYVTPEGDYYEGEFRLQPGSDVSSPWNGLWHDKYGRKAGEVVNGNDM